MRASHSPVPRFSTKPSQCWLSQIILPQVQDEGLCRVTAVEVSVVFIIEPIKRIEAALQAGYLPAWRQWLPCRQPVTARGAIVQRLSGVRQLNFLQQAERHFHVIFTDDKRPEDAALVIAFGDEAGR